MISSGALHFVWLCVHFIRFFYLCAIKKKKLGFVGDIVDVITWIRIWATSLDIQIIWH